MKANLAAKLQMAMRGGITAKTGVAGVTGVAGGPATCAKSLTLQRLRPLRVKTDKVANDAIRGVAGPVAIPPGPDAVEIEERKGMAAGGVPAAYLDAWSRLQCQKPMQVSKDDWRQAINDAGKFLDEIGSLAVEFQWTAAELFGVPGDDATCGLVWFINGEPVHSLGPEHAGVGTHQAYDRTTRREFVNAFGPGFRQQSRASDSRTGGIAGRSISRMPDNTSP